ncbi:hypothetical protein NKR19_g3132 [Coniochaeta hoffmannii]|uniref:Uncharacterized protein n=1 Tax=Coniochaeta hoffmannii TaxID=91930 RepID=A0AA38VMB8_9PEZI|nr:hypothetical protein NKR19_g3132 [Coniochaeta hoffmannii]
MEKVEKRLNGGVYVCPGPNWTGPCQHINMANLPGDFPGCWTMPWQTLGSIGPDAGWICSMFVEPGNCDGSNPFNLNSGGIVTPGVADLRFFSRAGKPQDYWFHNARTVQCIPS